MYNEPKNIQLVDKLSHSSYMFRHYRVILRDPVIHIWLSYTSISNAAVGNCKLWYQQLKLKYLCNLAIYRSRTPWRWHDSVETCRTSVIIGEIIVHLLVIVQNNKRCMVQRIKIIRLTFSNHCRLSSGTFVVMWTTIV